MVRFGLILSILGSSAALVSAHGDMDMDVDVDVDVATATATYVPSTTSIVPMPHEPKHLHGLPILQSSSLTPAERLYWENYNTTTYFTTQAGDRPALRYHVFTLLLVAFVLYPASLALSAARSRWYLPLLLGNLCVCVSSVMALCVFQRTFPEDGGDWYPHNIYATTSSLLLLFMLVHFLAAVLSVPVPSVRKSEYRPVDDAIPLDDLESTPVMVNSARALRALLPTEIRCFRSLRAPPPTNGIALAAMRTTLPTTTHCVTRTTTTKSPPSRRRLCLHKTYPFSASCSPAPSTRRSPPGSRMARMRSSTCSPTRCSCTSSWT